MPAAHTPMPYAARAELFEQLATMESAKLTFEHMINSLHLPDGGRERLQAMRKMLDKKVELGNAGENSGVFTKFEADLVRAAVISGNKERVYRRLAEFCRGRAEQSGLWKTKLALPLLALVAALFIRPIPGLMNGVLSTSRYIGLVFSSFAVAGAGIFLAVAIPQWLRMGTLDYIHLTPARAWVDQTLLRVPVFGEMNLRKNLRDFFESLALMLDAGMALSEALQQAQFAVTNSTVYRELLTIAPRVRKGESLSKVLTDMSFAGDGELCSLVAHGEATARLPEVLLKYAAEETSAVDTIRQQIATWLPWILYAVIAGWLAYGMQYGYPPEEAKAR
ncbi:type II secretion system F family protein [soil metagenome]